ncbi:MAG: hypothetical protein WCN92_13205 [Eubacteriales bacterium]
MQKILNAQLLDVLPYQQGILYSKKELLDNGSIKVSFHYFNQEIERSEPVSKNYYLEAKFGYSYRTIAEQLGDFINCETSFFPNGAVAVVFKNGDFYIFNSNGDIAFNEELLYQDSPIQSPAVDDKCIWFAVPERNAVISYSPAEQRVLLRIGGGKSTAFDYPVSITKILDKIYICNKNSYKIRSIKLEDYSVKDCFKFDEPVYKYFQVYDKQYAVLDSGIYLL